MNGIEETYVFDEGGYLYVAKTSKQFETLDKALAFFRKCYCSRADNVSNERDIESSYSLLASEMEDFKSSKDQNSSEFNEALNSWELSLQDWTLRLYDDSEYEGHLAQRDKLHEGIYESVTKISKSYIYWYHG